MGTQVVKLVYAGRVIAGPRENGATWLIDGSTRKRDVTGRVDVKSHSDGGPDMARDWLAAAFDIALVCADFEFARMIISGGRGDASVLGSKGRELLCRFEV